MGTHLLKVDHHFNNRCFKAFLPPPKAREFFPQSLENMGGCASKPKESDVMPPEAVPSEAPVSPKNAETEAEIKADAEAAADESKEQKNNGGEKQNEAPLVDLSEPKQECGEAASDEPKPAVIEPVSADSAAVTALQNPEDKVETAAIATTVVTKEEVKEKEEKVAEAEVEDKSDAPLVTL